MRRRIWILLAAFALAALAAWRFWPSGPASAPSAGEAGSEPGTAPDSAQEDGPRPPGGRQPPAPVRMQARSNTPAGPRPGLAVVFDGEDRNDEWASRREGEVRVRAGRVLAATAGEGRPAASLGAVECRSRSCRVSLAADDPTAVARAVERLGEEGGFYRFADQMTVEATEPGDGGPRRVNVYLRFAR
jgi:hypothetical protein